MKLKKIIAALLAATLLLTAAGCGNMGKDTSWAAKLEDQTISAGVYILNVLSGLNAASVLADPANPDFLKTTIEDKTGSQFVIDYAKAETQRQLATDKKYRELGLTMTEEEKQNYQTYAKEMYAADQEMYKANGISEQSVIDYNRYSLQAYKVFNALYTGEGEKAASQADMNQYFSDTYYLAYVVPYLKVDNMTGVALDETKTAELNTKVDADLKAVQDGTMSMADLVYKIGYEDAADQGEVPQRGEDSNYVMVIDKLGGSFPAVLTQHLATASANAIALVEDETYKIIVQKLDEKTAAADLVSYYYNSALPSMKQQEYSDLCTEWAAAMDIQFNDAAMKTYTGEKVKKETDAYMDKVSAAASQGASLSAPSLSSEAVAPSSEDSAPSSESASTSAG